MRPLVNLANEPFSNRRLFWLAIMFLFAIPLFFGLRALSSMASLEFEISKQKEIVRGLEAEYKKKTENPVRAKITISPDQNRELIAATYLIARRRFSWSQLLTDIERNLPPTVRVLRVDVSQILPQEKDGTIGGDITAILTLDVVGKSTQDVTAMITKFQESNRFKVVPLEKKTTEGADDIEVILKVDYFPLPPAARSGSSNQVAGGQAAAGQIAERKP